LYLESSEFATIPLSDAFRLTFSGQIDLPPVISIINQHIITIVWNKFDGKTGEVTDISTAIGYPIFEETYDKPNPAPACGIVR